MDNLELEEIRKVVEERDALLHENGKLHQQIVQIEQLLSNLLLHHEQEKQSLSHDLYHTIGQTMYSLYIGLQMAMKQDFDPSVKNHLLNLEKVTDQALAKIREISFDLHPFMIEDLGLVDTIKSYIGKMQDQGPPLQFRVKGPQASLSINNEHTLYRAFQEIILYLKTQPAVSTIRIDLHYVDSTTVEMSFSYSYTNTVRSEQQQQQQLQDDLLLIRHRIKLVKGDFQIDHSPASSKTTIRIRIPES
jgi:signal transduction histidine kinase